MAAPSPAKAAVHGALRRAAALPLAWRGRLQWRLRVEDFGDGMDFLAAWQAWRADPSRPRLLHVVAHAATPPETHDLLAAARDVPAWEPLARVLARQWWGLVPGVHRLAFEDGHVLLTLAVGEGAPLPAFVADDDGATVADPPRAPGTALVVGAGLAGAATAASLARRGWQVQVLDRAPEPAAGASGLPAGLLAPHTSADDHLLSRLSRAGVRLTWEEARRLLMEGRDWAPTGVREWRREPRALPALGPQADPWQQLDADGRSVRHAIGAWVRPAALVRAWLATPGVRFSGGRQVTALRHEDGAWQARNAQGEVLARADRAVVAAALGSGALVPGPLPLHAVRGQVSFGPAEGLLDPPALPVNGHGHFLPGVPLPGGRAWLSGSSYVRGDESLQVREAEHAANLERLQLLCPGVAAQLAPAFAAGAVQAWTGVRCASADRRPLVGELAPGLWVSTAMGSRGLTFAALAAELLAARWHGEPLPLEETLARALDARRAASRGAAAAP